MDGESDISGEDSSSDRGYDGSSESEGESDSDHVRLGMWLLA